MNWGVNMKKAATALLAIAIICVLFGCGKSAENPTATQPTDPLIPPKPTQQPMYAVSVPTVTEIHKASDGTEIFSYTHQGLILTMPEHMVADKVILEFLNRVDAYRQNAQDLLESAINNYTPSANWQPYSYSIHYSPMRIDQCLLSLFGNSVSFSGSSHPTPDCISVSYDLLTGDYLSLGSIMSAQAQRSDFAELVLQVLSEQSQDLNLRSGYEDTVRERFMREESQDQDWYFSENGLCFYFAPYDIAPYSSGIIVAEIPYTKLVGLLNDAYFPPERDASEGSICVAKWEDTVLSEINQIAELVTDIDAEAVFLYTQGLIRNVQISPCQLDSLTNQLKPLYTLHLSSVLSPGDAIMLRMDLSVQEIYRICYESAGTIITKYIQKNSDGTITLIDK